MQFPVKWRLNLLRSIGRSTWLPRKGRDRLLRLIWDPLRAASYEFEAPFFGHVYKGNLSNLIDWSVFSYGSYSYRELCLLGEVAASLKKKRRSISFFDIGANCGHHTLYMSSNVDKVFSFEPFPELCKRIEEKIATNNLTNVTIMRYGLGDENRELKYSPPPKNNLGTGNFLSEQLNIENSLAPTLPVRKGDDLFTEQGFPRADILKIDVEGFEAKVLKGLRNIIVRDRPFILMEWTDFGRNEFGSEQNLRDGIFENGEIYEVSGYEQEKYSLKPFDFWVSEEILIAPREEINFQNFIRKI